MPSRVTITKVGKSGFFEVSGGPSGATTVTVLGKAAANEIAGARRRVLLKRAERQRSFNTPRSRRRM